MKKLKLLLSVLLLTSTGLHAQTFHSMTPLAGFGPLGTGEILADGSVPFLSTGAIQRGLARNPVTGNLIFVDRGVSGQSADVTGAIYVLDGMSGSILATLSTNGIQGGSFADYAVGVASDGAIYVANVVNDTNAGPFKVYRYDSELSVNDPTVAFSGVLGTNNFRWGNTLDVRGSGASTEILVSAGTSGSTGATEAAVLTTADGVNFTATVLATDFPASLQGTLSFGIGNSYWAKIGGAPLRLLTYDLGTKTAMTGRLIGSPNMPEMDTPEIAAIDRANHLLATVNPHGANPDEVLLYDISNTNDLPQLLDSYTISSINNGNTGSPKGYLSLADGKLYVHMLNNGIFAFNLLSNTIPAPIILSQPQSKSLLGGSTVSFRVIAQRGLIFQWRKGVMPIIGETNSVLTLTNIQPPASGNYSVVVGNPTDSVSSSNALLTVLSPAETYHATQIWSTAPNAQPYFTTTGGSASTPNQRSLAYNSLSNQLYVVSRGGSSSANFDINVINPETGALLYQLNTNGVNFTGFTGQIGLVGIDCAADGSIYACNVDSSSPNVWRLYRWADGGSNTQPTQVFAGDPLGTGGSSRWGDNLAVRGSGINTEIIIDTQVSGLSGFIALLKPTDASLANFTSTYWFQENANGTTVGRSLQFGTGDKYWQRRKSLPLVLSSFSSESALAPVVTTYTNLPSTIGLVAIDETRNLLAAIDLKGAAGSSPDQVALYEISDISNPVQLSRTNFPVNKANNTGNIGKIIFGGDKLFALDAQNGLVAMRVELGISTSPKLMVSRSGGNVELTWEGNGFILEFKDSLNDPAWQPLSYEPGSPNVATDAISGTARFYRLRK